MNEKPQPDTSSQLSEDEVRELLRSLLHKEGTWVDWGQACQKLHQAGYSSQAIFEQTGFQASQQNLIIVAVQVYESLVKADADAELLSYLRGPRSDVLYELRILNQEQRLGAAELAQAKKLDIDGARQIAKAVQEFSRLSQLPAEFSHHPGDAIAYQCWKRARQKKDLQERSRLIAQGLKFAHSPGARQAIEKLLSDFTVVASSTAPLIPLYRLEEEEEIPYIVPVAGSLPLTPQELKAVSSLKIQEPFRVVEFSGQGSIVPVPAWQTVLQTEDPVAIFCNSDELPKTLTGKSEEVLVLVDRRSRQWNINSYFVVEEEGKLTFRWFEEVPEIPLLGQVILVLRPKKIFDENNLTEPWQMDD